MATSTVQAQIHTALSSTLSDKGTMVETSAKASKSSLPWKDRKQRSYGKSNKSYDPRISSTVRNEKRVPMDIIVDHGMRGNKGKVPRSSSRISSLGSSGKYSTMEGGGNLEGTRGVIVNSTSRKVESRIKGGGERAADAGVRPTAARDGTSAVNVKTSKSFSLTTNAHSLSKFSAVKSNHGTSSDKTNKEFKGNGSSKSVNGTKSTSSKVSTILNKPGNDDGGDHIASSQKTTVNAKSRNDSKYHHSSVGSNVKTPMSNVVDAGNAKKYVTGSPASNCHFPDVVTQSRSGVGIGVNVQNDAIAPRGWNSTKKRLTFDDQELSKTLVKTPRSAFVTQSAIETRSDNANDNGSCSLSDEREKMVAFSLPSEKFTGRKTTQKISQPTPMETQVKSSSSMTNKALASSSVPNVYASQAHHHSTTRQTEQSKTLNRHNQLDTFDKGSRSIPAKRDPMQTSFTPPRTSSTYQPVAISVRTKTNENDGVQLPGLFSMKELQSIAKHHGGMAIQYKAIYYKGTEPIADKNFKNDGSNSSDIDGEDKVTTKLIRPGELAVQSNYISAKGNKGGSTFSFDHWKLPGKVRRESTIYRSTRPTLAEDVFRNGGNRGGENNDNSSVFQPRLGIDPGLNDRDANMVRQFVKKAIPGDTPLAFFSREVKGRVENTCDSGYGSNVGSERRIVSDKSKNGDPSISLDRKECITNLSAGHEKHPVISQSHANPRTKSARKRRSNSLSSQKAKKLCTDSNLQPNLVHFYIPESQSAGENATWRKHFGLIEGVGGGNEEKKNRYTIPHRGRLLELPGEVAPGKWEAKIIQEYPIEERNVTKETELDHGVCNLRSLRISMRHCRSSSSPLESQLTENDSSGFVSIFKPLKNRMKSFIDQGVLSEKEILNKEEGKEKFLSGSFLSCISLVAFDGFTSASEAIVLADDTSSSFLKHCKPSGIPTRHQVLHKISTSENYENIEIGTAGILFPCKIDFKDEYFVLILHDSDFQVNGIDVIFRKPFPQPFGIEEGKIETMEYVGLTESIISEHLDNVGENDEEMMGRFDAQSIQRYDRDLDKDSERTSNCTSPTDAEEEKPEDCFDECEEDDFECDKCKKDLEIDACHENMGHYNDPSCDQRIATDDEMLEGNTQLEDDNAGCQHTRHPSSDLRHTLDPPFSHEGNSTSNPIEKKKSEKKKNAVRIQDFATTKKGIQVHDEPQDRDENRKHYGLLEEIRMPHHYFSTSKDTCKIPSKTFNNQKLSSSFDYDESLHGPTRSLPGGADEKAQLSPTRKTSQNYETDDWNIEPEKSSKALDSHMCHVKRIEKQHQTMEFDKSNAKMRLSLSDYRDTSNTKPHNHLNASDVFHQDNSDCSSIFPLSTFTRRVSFSNPQPKSARIEPCRSHKRDSIEYSNAVCSREKKYGLCSMISFSNLEDNSDGEPPGFCNSRRASSVGNFIQQMVTPKKSHRPRSLLVDMGDKVHSPQMMLNDRLSNVTSHTAAGRSSPEGSRGASMIKSEKIASSSGKKRPSPLGDLRSSAKRRDIVYIEDLFDDCESFFGCPIIAVTKAPTSGKREKSMDAKCKIERPDEKESHAPDDGCSGEIKSKTVFRSGHGSTTRTVSAPAKQQNYIQVSDKENSGNEVKGSAGAIKGSEKRTEICKSKGHAAENALSAIWNDSCDITNSNKNNIRCGVTAVLDGSNCPDDTAVQSTEEDVIDIFSFCSDAVSRDTMLDSSIPSAPFFDLFFGKEDSLFVEATSLHDLLSVQLPSNENSFYDFYYGQKELLEEEPAPSYITKKGKQLAPKRSKFTFVAFLCVCMLPISGPPHWPLFHSRKVQDLQMLSVFQSSFSSNVTSKINANKRWFSWF